MVTKNRTPDYLEIFIQDCRFRNLSEKTLKDYSWHLTALNKELGDWQTIDKSGVKSLVLRLMDKGLSPASANHYIRAAKAFYSFLVREGYLENNPMAGLQLVNMPRKLKPVLEPKQISKMLSSIPDTCFYKIRDKVMILILWDTAIRLKELLNIQFDDLDLKMGTVKITGKGNKDRIVPLGRKTIRELIKYLKHRGDNHSPLLFSTKDGVKIMQRNFQRTIAKYGQKIGVKVSPHLIRHSAATFLAKSEMPAQHIQILLGHSSLNTTQRYINQIVNQQGLQISHRRLSPGDRI
ncbi:MAG: tyrosine-type recombinase/integrase [Candidatus Zixiibacteriota bacterium]|nr:MAG: tyrosine-type recombinase/integrase [candidate division Zixibacteria bacterium]